MNESKCVSENINVSKTNIIEWLAVESLDRCKSLLLKDYFVLNISMYAFPQERM